MHSLWPVALLAATAVLGQPTMPTILLPGLNVRIATTGLTAPTSMAFMGPNEFLVLEKNTGRVQHVLNGALQAVALDLAVNNASERGLLGIALDPAFGTNNFVYLYWTCASTVPANPFFPAATTCPAIPQTGADTSDILSVPLLGNRVDRFIWNGATLSFDRNLIMLHSFQNDAAPDPPGQGDERQAPAGNHNGGVLAFGNDGKLFVVIGDNGRRSNLQNLTAGPGPTTQDDQFGGPFPDNTHFTGVILRLNTDGSAPADNPFFVAGSQIGGEVGANIQKIFAYGIRNSFGMAVDPITGSLWTEENGDDSFDEINRVQPGFNGGWVQIMGPVARLAEFKAIETSAEFFGLQQLRWSPVNIANSPAEALSRLLMLPGSQYTDPQFSWKYAVAPAAIGFVNSNALGANIAGSLLVGGSVPAPLGGPLFRFQLTGDRSSLTFTDSRLADRVADNPAKRSLTESESLLAGSDFGVVTDIKTGPNGSVFVVSNTKNAIFEIYQPATATCAANISASVDVVRRDDRNPQPDGHIRSQVFLTNTSGLPINGSITLVLDNLPQGVTLANQHGTTSCAVAGSPFLVVDVGNDGQFTPGETLTVVLDFTSTGNPVNFTTRVLSTGGTR